MTTKVSDECQERMKQVVAIIPSHGKVQMGLLGMINPLITQNIRQSIIIK